MKIPAAALAALLLVAICSLAECSQKPDTVPIECCFTYIAHHIPRNFITSAYRTNSNCFLPAVVLVTNKGRKVCVNPKALWVQRYLKELQMLEY
ncbi:C-C motif chemokine 3-like [Phalacrocorax aristotelis]|uniref:C-C motif chemokine 3-like n=1 Tax=Phalacrocorax aristotelis TaxID=126867 RepID=UPI003F4B729D